MLSVGSLEGGLVLVRDHLYTFILRLRHKQMRFPTKHQAAPLSLCGGRPFMYNAFIAENGDEMLVFAEMVRLFFLKNKCLHYLPP